MSTDYYAVLGIPETATREEIKKVYRALAKIYHPDSGITKDEEKFKGIQAAYDVLSDPTRRAAYDAERTSGPSTNGSAPEPEPPPAPDKSEWTAAEWKAYWQFGGTDLPGTWTDALRQAYRECGGTPPLTPEEEARIRQEEAARERREREKREAAERRAQEAAAARKAAEERAQQETREREAQQRLESIEREKRERAALYSPPRVLFCLALAGIGLATATFLITDPRHGFGVFEAISTLHEKETITPCQNPNLGTVVLTLLGAVWGIAAGISGAAALVALPLGLIVMTGSAFMAIPNPQQLQLALLAGGIAFGLPIAAFLAIRLELFLLHPC